MGYSTTSYMADTPGPALTASGRLPKPLGPASGWRERPFQGRDAFGTLVSLSSSAEWREEADGPRLHQRLSLLNRDELSQRPELMQVSAHLDPQ